MSLLARGRACLVTDAGSFAELPAGAVAHVAAGPEEEEHLLALFERLADDRALAAALGDAARRHVESRHAAAESARALHDFVADVVRAPREIPSVVPPLAPWDGDDPWLALLAGLGADLADLGVGEEEAETLGGIASRLVELGLDRTTP